MIDTIYRFLAAAIPISASRVVGHLLTAKGKYGLKALVHLATLTAGDTTPAIEIATAENIPKKFLDAILSDLRNAGIVAAKKGPGGGYTLARAPSEIKVGHVIRALDGPLAPIACASRTAYEPCEDCENVKSCAVRLTMSRVRDAMSDILDRLTVADMLALGEHKRVALHYHIRRSEREGVNASRAPAKKRKKA